MCVWDDNEDIHDDAVDMVVASTTVATELNDNEKRWLDDILSVGAYNFEKSQEKEQQQEETAQERKDPEVEATTISTASS